MRACGGLDVAPRDQPALRRAARGGEPRTAPERATPRLRLLVFVLCTRSSSPPRSSPTYYSQAARVGGFAGERDRLTGGSALGHALLQLLRLLNSRV